MTNSISEALKPCPFCGADKPRKNSDYSPYYECRKCGAQGPCDDDFDGAAKLAWNTRAQPVDTVLVNCEYCGGYGDDPLGCVRCNDTGKVPADPSDALHITPPLDSAAEQIAENANCSPLDSEAVERVIAEIDYQESAPESKGRFATVRIDDLRALLSLAKPVGGE